MPWKDAKEEAEKWVESLNLPQDLKGHVIDLHELGESLGFEGEYREMVLRAAARILKKRRAKIGN